MLSKRLKAICDFVAPGSQVIDVGADHALVDIYLTKYKNCQCLATDISSKSMQKARENIKKAQVEVATLITPGLENIPLKNETIIISGMGSHTILNILKPNITNDLIICTHTNLPLLRKELQKKGYHIHQEKAVFDKFYYVITYYKYGKKRKTDPYVSPFLTANYQYMRHLLNKYQKKLKYQKKIFSKFKYYQIVKKIKKKVK